LRGGAAGKGGPVGSVMFYAPVVIIAAAEFALMEDIGLGVILYAVVIGCFAVAVGFLHWRAACDPEGAGEFHGLADMLSAVMIVPLIRVFDFSLPLVFFRQAYWSMIVSLPLLVAVACLARAVGLGMRDVGLVWDGVLLQFAVGLTGIVFGFGEYALDTPAAYDIRVFPWRGHCPCDSPCRVHRPHRGAALQGGYTDACGQVLRGPAGDGVFLGHFYGAAMWGLILCRTFFHICSVHVFWGGLSEDREHCRGCGSAWADECGIVSCCALCHVERRI